MIHFEIRLQLSNFAYYELRLANELRPLSFGEKDRGYHTGLRVIGKNTSSDSLFEACSILSQQLLGVEGLAFIPWGATASAATTIGQSPFRFFSCHDGFLQIGPTILRILLLHAPLCLTAHTRSKLPLAPYNFHMEYLTESKIDMDILVTSTWSQPAFGVRSKVNNEECKSNSTIEMKTCESVLNDPTKVAAFILMSL